MEIKLVYFVMTMVVTAFWMVWRRRLPPSRRYGIIDAIVPAYNEELCLVDALKVFLKNPYFNQIIVVNDGSTDRTAKVLDSFARDNPRIIAVHQENTGKGGALMNGLGHAVSPYVFLSDADTIIPVDSDGLGYMLAEMDQGADAVGGIPASNLVGAGLQPYIRATVKLPMIIIERTFQQLIGGAPFIISGACGLFKVDVLRAVPFSDRTKVEDLDLTWSLVAKGYKVRQASRCIVYSQEANSVKGEWLRWRRWIIGYAVCMRLHRKLLLTRFGIFTIMSKFLVVFIGIAAYALYLDPFLAQSELSRVMHIIIPLASLPLVFAFGTISAIHHRKFVLIPLAPTAIFYLAMSYVIWLTHGLKGLFTGRELERDKPERYACVVE